MKRISVILIATCVVAWALVSTCASVVPWVWAEGAVADAASRPWPGGLGALASVDSRYPPLAANAAARRIAPLAAAIGSSESLESFLRREIEHPGLEIGEPPLLPDVSAIRELLLDEVIVWERRAGLGDQETDDLRGSSMRVARALVANALVKARNDEGDAWEDLRAVWNLARALDPYPQMMLQTAALSMARWINAAAWKMPLPPPAWFVEFQQRDSVIRLLEAFQYQVATYWQGRENLFPTKSLATSIDHDRELAEALFRESRAVVELPMNDFGTDLTSVWRRALRFRVEREATANALRIRQGMPIDASSRCRDGSWAFDGTVLRYSLDVPTSPPDAPMPLTLDVAQARARR